MWTLKKARKKSQHLKLLHFIYDTSLSISCCLVSELLGCAGDWLLANGVNKLLSASSSSSNDKIVTISARTRINPCAQALFKLESHTRFLFLFGGFGRWSSASSAQGFKRSTSAREALLGHHLLPSVHLHHFLRDKISCLVREFLVAAIANIVIGRHVPTMIAHSKFVLFTLQRNRSKSLRTELTIGYPLLKIQLTQLYTHTQCRIRKYSAHNAMHYHWLSLSLL